MYHSANTDQFEIDEVRRYRSIRYENRQTFCLLSIAQLLSPVSACTLEGKQVKGLGILSTHPPQLRRK